MQLPRAKHGRNAIADFPGEHSSVPNTLGTVVLPVPVAQQAVRAALVRTGLPESAGSRSHPTLLLWAPVTPAALGCPREQLREALKGASALSAKRKGKDVSGKGRVSEGRTEVWCSLNTPPANALLWKQRWPVCLLHTSAPHLPGPPRVDCLLPCP